MFKVCNVLFGEIYIVKFLSQAVYYHIIKAIPIM
jgi:hypothetical protein